VRMALAGHQLSRAFAITFDTSAAHEAAVVQKEPQQVEIRAAQVAAQREVGAQPRVEVLHQRAAARCLRHGPAHRVKERVELASRLRSEPVPSLPIRRRGAGQAVQQACLTHEGFGDGVGLRDVGQFRIEHAGEGEQVVALVLRRDPAWCRDQGYGRTDPSPAWGQATRT